MKSTLWLPLALGVGMGPLFDILFASLVFVALPPAFARPLWYALKKAPDPRPAVQNQRGAGAA